MKIKYTSINAKVLSVLEFEKKQIVVFPNNLVPNPHYEMTMGHFKGLRAS